MSIERPTLSSLIARAEADLSGRLLDGAQPLSRSVVGVLARVLGGIAHLQYGYLEWLRAQPFVGSAESEYLDRHGDVWAVPRKAATAATGAAAFAGADGAVIPAGTELMRVDGALYTTSAEAVVSGGVALATIAASQAGAAGDAPAGTALTLTAPVSGVQSAATVHGGVSGGADQEADEALRARILARIQQPPQGGSKSDYQAWALAVPGVTRAWVYPLHMGAGTVGVAIVADDAADGPIPSATLVAAAQAHIETLRPVTAEVFVFAPEALAVDIALTITPDTAAVRAAVQAELTDLFAREAEPGGTIYLSHIREAVSVAAGEADHVITSPAANVEATGLRFPVLGALTFG